MIRTMLLMVAMMTGFPLPAFTEGRTISVDGGASVHVVPDEVVIILGVETRDLDLTISRTENDRRWNGILRITDSLGVPRERVRTEYLNIHPAYEWVGLERKFLGYVVRRSVGVSLREVPKFESLLSAVLAAGANYVHGVDFRTTELRRHRDTARGLAIRAAREKAEALAGELGQKVGKPISISEQSTRWWSTYGSGWGGRQGEPQMQQNVFQTESRESEYLDGPVAPGQIAVSASVHVTFELED